MRAHPLGTTHPRTHPLEKAGAIQILVYIVRHGKAKPTELEKNLPLAQTAIYSSIERLIETGLLNDRKLKGERGGFIRELTLTEKGKQIARHCIAIAELL